jgi:hypothetical protein
MLRRTSAGSVKSRRAELTDGSPCAVLLCRFAMMGRGAELTLRWLILRARFAPGNLATRCFLAFELGDKKSEMEKERRGRAASSLSAGDRPRDVLLSRDLSF